jgi:hypothetical protein
MSYPDQKGPTTGGGGPVNGCNIAPTVPAKSVANTPGPMHSPKLSPVVVDPFKK